MNKSLIILAFLIGISFKPTISQIITSPNKEYFDYLYRYNLNNLSYYNQNNLRLEPTLPNELGNSISWQMMQLANLYEATHDKAYLVQIIHLSSNAIKNRFDIKNNLAEGFPPKWTLTSDNSTKESTYFNTILTIPMAKFIYLVRNNQILYNTSLPFNFLSSDAYNSIIYNDLALLNGVYTNIDDIITYGDYADWLGARVEETMHYLDTHYWDANLGHAKWLGVNKAAELNFQSCFATMYYWMYKMDHTFGPMSLSHAYLYDKLVKLKDLYFGNGGNFCLTDNSYNSSNFTLLQTSLVGNYLAYEWTHYGWQNFECETFLEEDVAHGAMDLFFPMADYENGQEFFTDNAFFEKMHNTLTQKLWIDEYNFYGSVYANNNSTASAPENATNLYYHEILDWMPLYKIDNENDPNNSVYHKLLQHADNLRTGNFYDNAIVYNNPSKSGMYHLGGTGALGLSEIIKAQWEKECVNLTLYNRDLVYDQDFNIKNRLTVSPASNYVNINNDESYASFADPIIYTPTFTVEDGVTVNMTAGESIDFYPGTSVVAGGILSAKIVPGICTDGKSMLQSTANGTNGADDKGATLTTNLSQKIQQDNIANPAEIKVNNISSETPQTSIVPNPAKDEITITNAPQDALINIFDLSGHLVLTGTLNSNNILDISSLSKGLYFVQLQDKTSYKMHRLVKL